jgi:hypothetical protein
MSLPQSDKDSHLCKATSKITVYFCNFNLYIFGKTGQGHVVVQLVGHCAICQKVAVLIPDEVIGIFRLNPGLNSGIFPGG